MATTRNNNRFENMGFKQFSKDMLKYGSGAMIGYEVKDIIGAKDKKEEVVTKITEIASRVEESSFIISKTNTIIFVALFLIMLYLILKHVMGRRVNNDIAQL